MPNDTRKVNAHRYDMNKQHASTTLIKESNY